MAASRDTHATCPWVLQASFSAATGSCLGGASTKLAWHEFWRVGISHKGSYVQSQDYSFAPFPLQAPVEFVASRVDFPHSEQRLWNGRRLGPCRGIAHFGARVAR
eukprot:scaffold3242_cov351-Prasinococcus_capsulatus_cf.AAC.5